MLSKDLKETLKLAIPITLSQLGQTLFGFVDTIMIGKVGTVPLSASAFVNNVFNVPFIFLLGISSAISVISSHHFGAKNYKESGRLLYPSLAFLTFFAFIVTMSLLALGNHLDIFQQPPEVLQESKGFYTYIVLSTIPATLFFGLKHYTESLSKPYIGVVAIGLGLFCNYILNLGFIYGNWGFPQMGLEGCGIATLISRFFTLFLLFGYIVYGKEFQKFKSETYKIFDMNYFKQLFKIGVPSGFQYLFEVMAFAGSGIMMGWLGTNELAAHQIVLQVASITFMVALGVAFATSVRIGQLKGQSDFVGIRNTGFSSLILISGFNFICGIIIIVFKQDIAAFFVNDPIVWELTSSLFIIAALFQLFDGTQAVGIAAHRALQDVRIPTLITFAAYWLCAIPLGYILAFKMHVRHAGIWWGLFLGLGVSSVCLILRFHKITKKLIQYQKEVLP